MIYQAQIMGFDKLQDNTNKSLTTSSKQGEKTISFNRVDYLIKWGIPSLLIALILWFAQIIFKQHGKIAELKNSLKQLSHDKKITTIKKLENLVFSLQKKFKSTSDEWSETLNSLNDRTEKLEFLYQRERLYRELEIPFIHWHGVKNCIDFSGKEKQVLKHLKFFDKKEYKLWLTPRDLLLLGVYKEICEDNYKQGLQLITEVLELVDVSLEIKAACFLQQARMLLEHKKNNVNNIYKILENAKSFSPQNISILFLDAKIRNDTGDCKIAATILEQIRTLPNANLFPINIDLTLADVYSNMKDYKKALDLVESYLIFHPYHVKSIKSKASIYCSDKKIDKATVEQFREQLQFINIGDDPELNYAIALLEYRLKKFASAEKRLNSIIIKRPSFIDYRSLLANIYFEMNKEEELLKTLEIIITLVANTKTKDRIKKIIENIEKLGVAKAKKTKRFNILLKY